MEKHGELLVSWEENILIIKVNGSFNKEGALAGITAIKESICRKNIETGHRLGFWDEEYLGSPSTMKMFKDAHEWCAENGCERVAVVVSNIVQQDVAEKIFSPHTKIFRIESDARKWLVS